MTAPIRLLTRDDAEAFRAVRLEGLARHPSAFMTSDTEFAREPLAEIAERLEPAPGDFVLGAWPSAERLAGVVGFHREGHEKAQHRGMIWGMYVRDEHHGRGLGAALLRAAIVRAARLPGLAVIELGVESGNERARRLYESCGFVVYGTQRDALRTGGRAHDELLLALHLADRDGAAALGAHS